MHSMRLEHDSASIRRQFVVHARNEKPVAKVDDGRPLDSKLRREFNENVKQSYGEGYGNVFSYGDVEMPKEVNTQGNDLQDAWKQLTQGKIDWMLFGFKNIKKDGGALEIKATVSPQPWVEQTRTWSFVVLLEVKLLGKLCPSLFGE